MRLLRAVFLLCLVAALAPVASAATGPYAGVVRQGETKTFLFDNQPPKGFDCVHMATQYTVTLAYAPTSDVLTLRAGGLTASGPGAAVTFWSGVCTSFAITVTGASVADAAAFVVTVRSGASPLGDPA